MIHHIVFWKMKDNAEGASGSENARKMAEAFKNLKGRVPELQALESGVDFNRSAAAYDIALHTCFNTKEDLDRYQNHPEHLKIVEFVKKVTADRRVVDFEM